MICIVGRAITAALTEKLLTSNKYCAVARDIIKIREEEAFYGN